MTVSTMKMISMDDNDDVDTNYDDDDETNESDTINIIMMMTKI